MLFGRSTSLVLASLQLWDFRVPFDYLLIKVDRKMNLLHTLPLLKSVELLLLEVRLMTRNMADSAVATGLALPHPEGVRIPHGASIPSCRLHWSNTSWTRMVVLQMRIVTLLSSVGGRSVFYFSSIHVKWLAILFVGQWRWVWGRRTPFSLEIRLGTGCWSLLSLFWWADTLHGMFWVL